MGNSVIVPRCWLDKLTDTLSKWNSVCIGACDVSEYREEIEQLLKEVLK